MGKRRTSFEFASAVEAKQAHQDDHAELHRAYNAIAFMPAPSSASANLANFKAALVDAIDAYEFGGELRFPPGGYAFNATLEVQDALGLVMRGTGTRTHLNFDVPDGADWLALAHCHGCDFSHLYLNGAGGLGRAAISTLRTNAPGMTYAPSHNLFNRIVVNGNNRVKSAFLVSGEDANNDFHHVVDCVFQGYTERGIDLRYMSQSYNNLFDNVLCYGGAGALYGLDMSDNVGGSFCFRGGIMNNHLEADFRTARSDLPCLIEFVNSEGSGRFLIASGSYGSVIARGVRWAGNKPHADRQIIRAGGRVHLTLESCFLGGSGAAYPFTFNLTNLRGASMQNCVVYSNTAAVFSNATPAPMINNVRIPDEGTLVEVPLIS